MSMYRDFVCRYLRNDGGFYVALCDVVVIYIVRVLRYLLLTIS